MNLHQVVNALFNSVSYVIEADGPLYVIDPGETLISEWPCDDRKCVGAVLLTHAHFDHIGGLNVVLERNPGAVVYTNAAGAEMLTNPKRNMSRYHEGSDFVLAYPERVRIVKDGDSVGPFRAIFTPGHNPSCVTWVGEEVVFSGDSLIPGIKTVTNLPGGNRAQAEQSEALIRGLAEGKRLLPGHEVEL